MKEDYSDIDTWGVRLRRSAFLPYMWSQGSQIVSHELLVHFKYLIKTKKVATQSSFVQCSANDIRGLKLLKLP